MAGMQPTVLVSKYEEVERLTIFGLKEVEIFRKEGEGFLVVGA